jgi:hypothetical protein
MARESGRAAQAVGDSRPVAKELSPQRVKGKRPGGPIGKARCTPELSNTKILDFRLGMDPFGDSERQSPSPYFPIEIVSFTIIVICIKCVPSLVIVYAPAVEHPVPQATMRLCI